MSTLSIRRPVSLLAVLAMVATMLFAFASTAAIAASPPSNACPSSIPDAGFTDIGALSTEAQASINCIASYGITTGITATTYGPALNVTRAQMALFLTRKLTSASVSLPSGVAQGFTDIGGLPAATQTAINQLAQLDITKGTTATTYSPAERVTRSQMALFITRQLTAAGVALPSGVAQGFTDIGGLPAATQTAINQLAQLDISKGTTATTYGPTGNVTRSQMGMFLARDLDVLGVVPIGLRVTVTPATSASLADNAARAYSATFRNADGSLYSGFVGIRLMDATTAGAPIYNVDAVNVLLESVDGAAVGNVYFGGFAGTDGMVSFIIRNGAASAATDAVPVAWIDLDADGGWESTGNNAPTEPFALGGWTKFAGPPPAEAVAGFATGVVVQSVDAAGNSFVGDRDNGGVGDATFEYDSNDIFQLAGANLADIAAFEALLSETDVLSLTYFITAAGVSTFNITTNNSATSSLKVTDPASAKSINSANYTIKGTGEVGAAIRIYADTNDDGLANEAVLGTDTVASDGTWSVTVPLAQNAANNFVAWQKVGTATPTLANVPTITEGAPAAAKLSSSVGLNVAPGTAGQLDPDDTIVITFNEKVAGVSNGDSIAILDSDGSTATLVLGADVGWALDGTGKILTLTINTLVFASGGSVTGIQPLTQIQSISGFQGADGLAIDVTGSGGGRVFDSF